MGSVVASAQVLLFVNGTLIGRVTDFRWTSVTNHIAIYGLDRPEPLELAPTTTLVQGAMTVYRTLGDGGAEGMGVTTQLPDAMRQKYTDLELVERSTGLTLFKSRYTKFNNQDWGAPLRGFLQGQLTFVGLTWTNELAQAPQ